MTQKNDAKKGGGEGFSYFAFIFISNISDFFHGLRVPNDDKNICEIGLGDPL